jgi:hypothetical protein
MLDGRSKDRPFCARFSDDFLDLGLDEFLVDLIVKVSHPVAAVRVIANGAQE